MAAPTLAPVFDRLTIVAHGRPAGRALAAAIGSAQAGDPLAPVTVLVPSNFAGLSVRRLLGSGELGGRGIANVDFITPFRAAELLAVDRLGGKVPLTMPLLRAAVRRVLSDDPRLFGPVAEHRATEDAVVGLVGELGNVASSVLDRLARSGGITADLVEIHRAVWSHLGDVHDEAAVAEAATRRADLAEAATSFGHIVWYLPEPLSAPLQRFLAALFAVTTPEAILALTGSPDADAGVRSLVASFGVDLDADEARTAVPGAPPTASHLVSVTDADEEIRAVVRAIAQLAEEGVPLHRIGVFHPVPDPYARILEQQFAAAGIPANGPDRRPPSSSVAGRTLLRALSLPAVRWRRDHVMALAAGGPIRFAGEPVRAGSWERLSREAGIVGDTGPTRPAGVADWTTKLRAHRRALESERERRAAVGLTSRPLDRPIDDTDHLLAFVEGLQARIGDVDAAADWRAKADAAGALLVELLGPAHQHVAWPDAEADAFLEVERAIARLAALDPIDPAPTSATFLRALSAELDTPRGRVGRFGTGVLYGPLVASIGFDLDAVFVVGTAEGLLPAARRDDAVLPDAVRAEAGGQLPLRADRLGEQHRAFLAALAAAPPDRRWLVFPRGDLRSGRRSLPSRWLLDSASDLAGRRVAATDFADLGPDIVEEVPSQIAGLRTATHHGPVGDRDLAAVDAYTRHGGTAADHPAAAVVARGLAMQAARRSAAFTEFDGNLDGEPIDGPSDQPLSPSRLEAWAACGFRYFLASSLGLSDRDDPERVIDLSPLDRGSGVHEVLERFIGELVECDEVPEPDEPWSPRHRARVAELASEVFDAYAARGRTGRPVRWQITRRDLLALLDDFLTADDRFRSAERARPAAVEMPFGLGGHEPVELALAGGRRLRFRGIADRVDRTDDGRWVVSDYKTGKGREYRSIERDDPVQEGTTLQLGLYAEAARQRLGADRTAAHYWMVNATAGHVRLGYEWTDERRERLLDVVATIADGIEAGLFPAVPGEWNSFRGTFDGCVYCEFDPVCPRDRGEQAAAKVAAVELRGRDGLRWEPS